MFKNKKQIKTFNIIKGKIIKLLYYGKAVKM